MLDFDSADYGEMTLAKIPNDGVEFLLESIEKGNGKFGEYRIMKGKMNGESYEIKVSSKRVIDLLNEKGDLLIGKQIRIVPKGAGMDKTYRITGV